MLSQPKTPLMVKIAILVPEHAFKNVKFIRDFPYCHEPKDIQQVSPNPSMVCTSPSRSLKNDNTFNRRFLFHFS